MVKKERKVGKEIVTTEGWIMTPVGQEYTGH